MATYVPVGKPSNESERRGIRMLRDQLPDHYAVIGNFDLQLPRRKNTMEFDAVVVGEWSLYAVEIKGWGGTISGDVRTWELEWGRVENPFIITERKAKALRDALVRNIADFPDELFCESVVLLPRDDVDIQIADGRTDHIVEPGGVYDFFVDEQRLYEKGPGPLLDDTLREEIIDAIVPIAEPASGLPNIPAYEVEGELERPEVLPYREFVGHHRYLKNRQKVRIKRYSIDPLLSPEQRVHEFNRIFRDMEALESLDDNIYVARAYDMVRDQEDELVFHLLSEWVGPRTLRDFIDEVCPGGCAPADDRWERAITIALHLLRAVDFMHDRDIVHRNLNPGVVYLTDDDSDVPLKIADFDYARVANLRSIAGEFDAIGTEGYIAPEMWEDDDYDHRVDIFSSGAILYEMFAGEPLFTSMDDILRMEQAWSTKREAIVPDEFREILDGLTHRDPDVRSEALQPAIEQLDMGIAQTTN